jgi:DNA-binding CsgD family transcriptional regulator
LRSPRPWKNLGCALQLRELRDEAVETFDQALILNTRTGALRDAARVRHRLRELGARRRVVLLDRPRVGPQSLTDAELRVAFLVADGNTNRAVAEKLYLSPHTVNSHLRHVFEKLAVNSRTELARTLQGMSDQDPRR